MRLSRMRRVRAIRALALAMIAAAACSKSSSDERSPTGADGVRATAHEVVVALAGHDMARLASFVDPTRGLRFSPYTYVDTTADRVVAARDVSILWSNADSTRWGSYDGSGEPIVLPYSAYHAKFVYDADFQHAPRIAVDSLPIGHGNTTSNIAEVYRGASIVEYHWPGTATTSGMDWRSLWLVFHRDQTRWYLIGIVHGAWTI